MIPTITNKNTLVLIFLSLWLGCYSSLSAQDILYLKGGGKLECLITELEGPKVKYKMWQNRRGQDYVVPKTRLHLIFFQEGGYAAFDQNEPDGMLLNKVKPESDFLLTNDGQLSSVKITEKSEIEIRFTQGGDADSKLLENVLLILNRDGSYQLLGDASETARLLIEAKKSSLIKKTDPTISENQPLDKKDISTPKPIPTANTQPNRPAIDNSSFELNSVDKKEFSAKALDKTRNLGQYFSIIADKETNWQDANEAIDLAVKLFVNEDAQVEVSSTSSVEKKTFGIRKYLERLKLLKYERVEISWSDIAYISNLKKGVDGNYYGVVSFVQKFTGYRDGAPVYSDYTRKNIEVVLKGYTKQFGGQTHELWDVFLSDIGVVNTRRG